MQMDDFKIGEINMKYVRLQYDNNKLTTAELKNHRDVIDEYVEKGYKYIGFIPVIFGPSGKTLAIDLIFEKNSNL